MSENGATLRALIADTLTSWDDVAGTKDLWRSMPVDRLAEGLTMALLFRAAPPSDPAAPLDVKRLAFAIAAAEGGDGWTPWGTETTNAEMIAAKYGGLDVHTHHPECGFCNPSLLISSDPAAPLREALSVIEAERDKAAAEMPAEAWDRWRNQGVVAALDFALAHLRAALSPAPKEADHE